jgi:hypothetical protein
MFENKLKQKFQNQRNITYDVADLFAFIDDLSDMGALVYVTTNSFIACVFCRPVACDFGGS